MGWWKGDRSFLKQISRAFALEICFFIRDRNHVRHEHDRGPVLPV